MKTSDDNKDDKIKVIAIEHQPPKEKKMNVDFLTDTIINEEN